MFDSFGYALAGMLRDVAAATGISVRLVAIFFLLSMLFFVISYAKHIVNTREERKAKLRERMSITPQPLF